MNSDKLDKCLESLNNSVLAYHHACITGDDQMAVMIRMTAHERMDALLDTAKLMAEEVAP